MTPGHVARLLSLIRWLGPWTADSAVPGGVSREHWLVREGPLVGPRATRLGPSVVAGSRPRIDAYVYRPADRAPAGCYVVAPGLHYDGPDDPRLDRFCRVMARAGFVVVAPFLPAFVQLLVDESAPDDLEELVVAASTRFGALGRPTVFSISFGSWPALEVAARRPDLVDAVVTFGGYARFDTVARFCVGVPDAALAPGRAQGGAPRDPTNMPALFLNLLGHLEPGLANEDRAPLEQALRAMCHRSWGRPEMKRPGQLSPLVSELAASLSPAQRDLFVVLTGHRPGAAELLDQALKRAGVALDGLGAERAAARLRCPVVVCHGTDDDVIPWEEAQALHRLLEGRVPTRLYLTGLYAHTSQGGLPLRGALNEAATMLGIARTLASGGQLRQTLSARRA
jgi:pimeloyl-ACP methyl ester carboxylesterase